MKLVFFISLSFSCFSQVILLLSFEVVNGGHISGKFKSKEFRFQDRLDNKTGILDLNDDCQLLILERLDFNSLFSLPYASSRYKPLVSKILKPILQEKMVIITSHRNVGWARSVEIGYKYIEINHLTTAKRFLNNFGHLIQKLELRHANSSIYNLVNLHCSKTLNEIKLDNSMYSYLNEFTNSFENVQNVSIWNNNFETERPLNEIFPSIRRIELSTSKSSDSDSIIAKYTQLEHLSLNLYTDGNFPSQKWAAKLITKNPHIRSLTLQGASVELIKIAADSIPQLEKLKLLFNDCEFNNEPIHFENLKFFAEQGNNHDQLFSNVKFGNVEEVHLSSLAMSMFGETGFLRSNQNLKKLWVVSSNRIALASDEFRLLAQAPTQLQDIFIANAQNLEVEPILQLIVNNKQLERLEIEFQGSRFRDAASEELKENGLKALRDEIGEEWTIDAWAKNADQDTMILQKINTLF